MSLCWAVPLYGRHSYLATMVLPLDPRHHLVNKDSLNIAQFLNKEWPFHCNLPPPNNNQSEDNRWLCLEYALMYSSDLLKCHCLQKGIPIDLTQVTTLFPLL